MVVHQVGGQPPEDGGGAHPQQGAEGGGGGHELGLPDPGAPAHNQPLQGPHQHPVHVLQGEQAVEDGQQVLLRQGVGVESILTSSTSNVRSIPPKDTPVVLPVAAHTENPASIN